MATTWFKKENLASFPNASRCPAQSQLLPSLQKSHYPDFYVSYSFAFLCSFITLVDTLRHYSLVGHLKKFNMPKFF